ncbi:M56 family metallopeptidase [Acrocarpospora catenulata]|uniref:M56 family metallopeptidase n=1 Tax=Acrocarpospora catenulata TaxID=2836182 RepID=UPI001BDB3AF9|nr:M56 family metallopeptidase [Acrocarpospora catenulata]
MTEMRWFMDADGYLPFAVSVLGMLIARPLSERLPPRSATWLITLLAVATAVASTLTLLVLAAEGVVQLAGFATYTGLPLDILRGDAQTSPLVAALASVALTAGAAGLAVVAVRLRRARRASADAVRDLPGEGLVAVLDDDVVDAFAVPGRPGRVVISTGMLAVLDENEQRVLLAHEEAHLRDRHHMFRNVTRAAAAVNPLLRPLARAVVYSTERWADERAADAVGDRTLAARALGRAALSRTTQAQTTQPRSQTPPPDTRAEETPAEGVPPTALGIGLRGPDRPNRPGPLPRRVRALLLPIPHHGLTLPLTIVLSILAALWGPYDLALDLRDLIEGAHAGQRRLCGSAQ